MFSFYNNTYFWSYETLVLHFSLLHPDVLSGKKKNKFSYLTWKVNTKAKTTSCTLLWSESCECSAGHKSSCCLCPRVLSSLGLIWFPQ